MYDPSRPTALLLAGRVLDSTFPQVRHLHTLRELAGEVDELSVVLCSDETYRGPSEPEDSLHCRVAIGMIFGAVTADDTPLGPLSPDSAMRALQRIQEVPKSWWNKAADALGPSHSFSPAARRKGLTDERIRRGYVGVAFDGPDLARAADRIHIVATGPLARARIARGKLSELPLDEFGDVDIDELDDEWQYGQDSTQEPHRIGVRGQLLGSANILGWGAYALDDDIFTQPGTLYLIARYD